MQQKADEKMDPLMRIQEEIKEVVRREEEYRQLATVAALTATPPIKVEPAYEANYAKLNGNAGELDTEHVQDQDRDEVDQGVLVTAQPAAVTALLVPSEEQSPSLASSVNSNSHKEESLDEQHSDDSGISASSLKTNNNNNNNNNKAGLKLSLVARQESRYIGPNCYNLTPEPPQQKLMTRSPAPTQAQQLQQQKRQFAFHGATKGVMQRFIASHGKLQLGSVGAGNGVQLSPLTPNGNSPGLKLNTRNALAFLESGSSSPLALNLNLNNNHNNNNNNNNNNNIIGSSIGSNGTSTLSQGAIERDSEGRPLRRGYVPVEQKIQRELQDLKSRESELKRLRKLNRQHMLEKLQLSTDDEADADDDDDDSEVEHCYGPGKLRNAQSTLELERESNDLELMGHKSLGNRSLNAAAVLSNGGNNALTTTGSNSFGMRPAMSLAELCDLTPEEAPSSHRLIAQWESLIKKNAEGIEAAI
ncbi:nuclear transcription factor Y subunit alpha [Drosophila virilis]|uniref:nuclear transcription factor Y subunit alpha n=1 Tax=Drosophila virilis TaxID=7244 RepID=UPI0013965577|nr:probable serine/threonine-protein kinase cdc7 [Drosophila virilis]